MAKRLQDRGTLNSQRPGSSEPATYPQPLSEEQRRYFVIRKFVEHADDPILDQLEVIISKYAADASAAGSASSSVTSLKNLHKELGTCATIVDDMPLAITNVLDETLYAYTGAENGLLFFREYIDRVREQINTAIGEEAYGEKRAFWLLRKLSKLWEKATGTPFSRSQKAVVPGGFSPVLFVHTVLSMVVVDGRAVARSEGYTERLIGDYLAANRENAVP